MALYHTFRNTVQDHSLIHEGDTVVAGVSGGSDSVAMLGLLIELREALPFTVVVAHVDYHLRKDSELDENLVKALAVKYGVEVVVYQANPDEQTGNLEAWARGVRYSFFRSLAQERGAAAIAVAHTKDDQAETILMNFLRGAGMTGLSGMKERHGKIVRPLLNISKEELRDYVVGHKLDYREDSTNQHLRYDRNHIRNELLPLIAERYNPNFTDTLVRMGAIFADNEELVLDQAGDFFHAEAEHLTNEIHIPREALASQPRPVRREVIHAAMKSFGHIEPLSFEHSEQVQSLLEPGTETGKEKELSGNLKMVVERDVVRVVRGTIIPGA